jgi:UDP-2,3-diacylglucosamine pyrophosphatase LpxH
MQDTKGQPRHRLRSVFISDVHLGSRDCRADELLKFLAGIETDNLYIVGDLIDFWSLRRSFYWPRAHGDVVRAILDRARAGTRVVYIPGNHDEELRELCGSVFANLQVRREFVHETADGREMLVIHGDELDTVVRCSRWLARIGSGAYSVAMGLNRLINAWRKLFGLPFWSLAGYLKTRIGNAARYVDAFERAAAHIAAQRGLDGIICGHIHRSGIRDIDGVLYCNDGDWVESCTAVVEDMSGRLSLWTWSEVSQFARREKYLEAVA